MPKDTGILEVVIKTHEDLKVGKIIDFIEFIENDKLKKELEIMTLHFGGIIGFLMDLPKK